MSVGNYQAILKNSLEDRLGFQTIVEWRSQMGNGLYAPRVDVAIGPFAIEDGIHMTAEHNDVFNNQIQFFRMLCKIHLENLGLINEATDGNQIIALINQKVEVLYYTNYNARCFMAIEVENNVSRKHLMGGAINASVLGRIGIAVGYNDEKHRAFLNLYRYFEFLRNVDKPTFNTSNLLIISKDQLLNTIETFNNFNL
ncbi:hypothetical protein [Pedobacter frigoris]|uniref:Uncharacterized protein n=1 Tax=Pedobacter frigoris TaxID=2571272 RepID=A0A4U1CGV8_9SPHI|nr:hypothetical protein [Pedobacter frigoris]TKC04346.1 hypothetical protein FA047_17330 [Pedobacter frigoris]